MTEINLMDALRRSLEARAAHVNDACELAQVFRELYQAGCRLNEILERNEELNGTVPEHWPIPASADEWALACLEMEDHYKTLAREMLEEKKIITNHVFPPIPDRRWDWTAYHEGQEETGHAGWGATEQEALDDLRRLDEERAEAEEENHE